MSEAPINDSDNEPGATPAGQSGEMRKFIILAVIMLGTVVVVALLRPLIFGRIVPAVLGEGQATNAILGEEIKAESVEEESETAIETEDTSDVETETPMEESADSEDVIAEPTNPADFPTAVPALTHVVQAGETLTVIAQRYHVTINDIVVANDIPNPDRVAVGTTLIIPQP